MAKSNFEPARIYPQKRYSAPAPRGARFFARIMLVVLGVILIAGAVFIVKAALDDPMKWSDEKALAQIQAYRQQDMVNLNQYLIDRGYRAFGEPDAYNYIQDDSGMCIYISRYETEEVHVGDGEGNFRQFGAGLGEIYLCRVGWLHEKVKPHLTAILAEPNLRDISMSAEAVAEVVRLANR